LGTISTTFNLGLPYLEAEQMFRRMVFNVLARNCDDHTKNFSFLVDKGGTWHLASAYDVCHAYDPTSRWVSHHCLSISEKRMDINIDDMLRLAKEMNIKNATSIIKGIRSVITNWDRYATEVGVNLHLMRSIKDTFPAIE
jgi:serine/threonine-protein kinase HipA